MGDKHCADAGPGLFSQRPCMDYLCKFLAIFQRASIWLVFRYHFCWKLEENLVTLIDLQCDESTKMNFDEIPVEEFYRKYEGQSISNETFSIAFVFL